MSAHLGGMDENKDKKIIYDVITIDDEEEDIECIDEFENDEIEVIEVIAKRAITKSLANTSPPNDLKPKTNGLLSERSDENFNNSCDNCFQTTINSSDLNQLNGETCAEPTLETSIEPKVDISIDSKVDIKAPKRATLTTLSTSASTSTTGADNLLNESTTDVTPNKVARTASPIPPPIPSSSRPKVDFETLYQTYLNAFRDRMSALETNQTQTEELIQKLDSIFLKMKDKKIKILESNQFSKLMEVYTKEVTEMPNELRTVGHHRDLIIEMNRLATDITKSNTIKVKNKAKRIKELTNTLKKLQKQIFAAENEEYDYEAMDGKTSFTNLPKLYKKANEVWAKREELLNRSTNSGRVLYKRFKYNGTDYPEINRLAENLFNNHMKKIKNKKKKGYIDESFTFIDIRKAVLEEINSKQLVAIDCETITVKVYKDLLSELRSRRQRDSEEVFETLETLDDLRPETFVESSEIDIECAKNKSYFERKMEELCQKYTLEDHKKNGESVISDGHNEWDSNLLDSEEFESLDVKDGDLEDEEKSEDEKSDENMDFGETAVPEFNTNCTEQPVPTQTQSTASTDDDCVIEDVIVSKGGEEFVNNT